MHFTPFLLSVPYLSAALGVRITLQDVSHHGSVAFLHCPVEGSLSILIWKGQGKYLLVYLRTNKLCQK